MNAKHTPGPWHTGKDSRSEVIVFGEDKYAICDAKVWHGRHAEGTAAANARLIAAAPELLEALRNLLAYSNKYSDTMAAKLGRGAEELGELADSSSVAGMARAAIAKATGGDHA